MCKEQFRILHPQTFASISQIICMSGVMDLLPPSNICFDLTNYVCVMCYGSPSTLKRLPQPHKLFACQVLWISFHPQTFSSISQIICVSGFMNLPPPLSGTGYTGLFREWNDRQQDRGVERMTEGWREDESEG